MKIIIFSTLVGIILLQSCSLSRPDIYNKIKIKNFDNNKLLLLSTDTIWISEPDCQVFARYPVKSSKDVWPATKHLTPLEIELGLPTELREDADGEKRLVKYAQTSIFEFLEKDISLRKVEADSSEYQALISEDRRIFKAFSEIRSQMLA